MSHDAESDLPSIGHPEFDILLAETRAWLAAGRTDCRLRRLPHGTAFLRLHSDFGPAEQDKETNQDYALAWRPSAAEAQPRLVLALGDGLTTSYRSECGSALACWAGLRALVENAGSTASKDLARLAFNEAGQAIGRLADELARQPEASCPEGQFPSTWKYILRKGGLFQTTLTLAWLDNDHFCIAMLGDGGVLWRDYDNVGQVANLPESRQIGNLPHARQANDRILAACDLNSQQVYALGPADRSLRDFDCWHEEKVNGPFLCTISTDGIGRGFGASPLTLLDELEKLQAAGVENTARRFIEHAIRQRPKDFEDNVTLAVIREE